MHSTDRNFTVFSFIMVSNNKKVCTISECYVASIVFFFYYLFIEVRYKEKDFIIRNKYSRVHHNKPIQ